MSATAAAPTTTGPATASPHRPSVLHLVQPAMPAARRWLTGGSARGTDAGLLACRALIGASPDLDHKVIVIGGGPAGRRAAQFGVEAAARIAPPMGRPELAGRALRGWLAVYGEPRVIQCWGGEFAGLRGRVTTHRALWCVADMRTGTLDTRAPLGPPTTTPLTPSAPAAAKTTPPRTRSSRILLAGDPPSDLDALAFCYALAILHVAGIRTIAAVPRGAARLDRALRHVRAGGYLHRLEVIDDSPLARPGDFDLAVCLPLLPDDGPAEPSFASKLIVRALLESGLPVVVQDCAWSRDAFPAAAHACLAPSPEPARLARVLAGLLEGDRLDTIRQSLSSQPRPRGLVDEVLRAWGLTASVSPGRA